MGTLFRKIFPKKQDEETRKRLARNMTANEFVNVKDIRDGVLYSKDDYLFSYLRIEPISLELLTPREQRAKGKQFSAEFSAIKTPYKFFSLSRPVDVSFMIDNFKNLQIGETDRKRRELMNEKIKEINAFTYSGEIIEHQFYMVIWAKNGKHAERDVHKLTNEVMARFKSLEMVVTPCKDGEIAKLLNQFANPSYAHLENEEYKEYIPFVGD